MRCLEDPDVKMENGIYWCYREKSGLPDERILKLITDKNGLLVRTAGFDSVMLALGNALAPKEIEPQNVGDYLKKQCDDRVSGYEKHYNELMKESLEKDKSGKRKPESESEREFKEDTKELDKRVEDIQNSKLDSELTAWDYVLKGDRAFFEEDYNRAILFYDEAIKIDPKYEYAYLSRGSAYHNLEKYDKAIEDYSKAIEYNPEDLVAYINRGIAYGKIEKYGKAIEDYSKAIELKPEDVDVYLFRGDAYLNLKEHDKAIESFSKAIALKSDSITAYSGRAIAYDSIGETEKAMADIKMYEKLKAEQGDLDEDD